MMDMRMALDVLDRHHQGDLPIKMLPLAKDLGIDVFSVPNWPGDLSGMIKKSANSESGFAIYVNRSHPQVRRRFTIAHECAHAILHTELIGDGIVDDALYRSDLSNSVEAQANRLAADILMPRKRLDGLIASGITSVKGLGCTLLGIGAGDGYPTGRGTMISLREARDSGAINEFIAQQDAASAPTGDKAAFNRALKAMAGTSKAVPATSKRRRSAD